LIAALEAISPKLPPDLKVIPGHGVISNLDDVRAYVKRLKETLAVVEQGVRQGRPWTSSGRKRCWNRGRSGRATSSPQMR